MCQFKSAIILRSPTARYGFKLLHSPATDSHSTLIDVHKLHDNGRCTFARVEFLPREGEEHLPERYLFRLDEDRTPDWWTSQIEGRVVEALQTIVRGMLAQDGQHLLGGAWIIPGGVKVAMVGEGTIVRCNRGTINHNGGVLVANYGSVRGNSGEIKVHYQCPGAVLYTNNKDGRVGHCYGNVPQNDGVITHVSEGAKLGVNYGSIGILHAGITIGTNRGAIENCRGLVGNNFGYIDCVSYSGVVEFNCETIHVNYGRVQKNTGAIITNHGRVGVNLSRPRECWQPGTHSSGTVLSNPGVVEQNDGTVLSNYGTIETNSGLVVAMRDWRSVPSLGGGLNPKAPTVETNTPEGGVLYSCRLLRPTRARRAAKAAEAAGLRVP